MLLGTLTVLTRSRCNRTHVVKRLFAQQHAVFENRLEQIVVTRNVEWYGLKRIVVRHNLSKQNFKLTIVNPKAHDNLQQELRIEYEMELDFVLP